MDVSEPSPAGSAAPNIPGTALEAWRLSHPVVSSSPAIKFGTSTTNAKPTFLKAFKTFFLPVTVGVFRLLTFSEASLGHMRQKENPRNSLLVHSLGLEAADRFAFSPPSRVFLSLICPIQSFWCTCGRNRKSIPFYLSRGQSPLNLPFCVCVCEYVCVSVSMCVSVSVCVLKYI